ncbi:MAG TPA: SigE family RNA polymerase sigma factor [Acidimicrobiales bacterium]|nr:SigE family RNA polymerase sigma factor [Acidimicrobiales bacterium]
MTADPGPVVATPWADALVGLYRERYAPMVRLAYLLTGDRSAAEELVQDAFVSVHRSWARVGDPPAYLRTVVVNGCRSWGRHRSLEVARRPAAGEPAALVADELWDALGRLPERQRAAVVLRFYEDLPDVDIATVLGCRRATVRTAVHRGLAALRKELVT